MNIEKGKLDTIRSYLQDAYNEGDGHYPLTDTSGLILALFQPSPPAEGALGGNLRKLLIRDCKGSSVDTDACKETACEQCWWLNHLIKSILALWSLPTSNREFLRLPLEKRREILKKQVEEFLKTNPDFSVNQGD